MQISKFWCSAVPCLVASVALALLTLICYRLHFNLATASILYVIVVVLLARTGTFVSSVVASIIAALGLAYLAPRNSLFGLAIRSTMCPLLLLDHFVDRRWSGVQSAEAGGRGTFQRDLQGD